ncbi:hypothetical protein MUU72_17705 [Streptomyces sp. RS10V-4]|uniref:hypothetical protein n=1 Tax=Streptomyces rhizoryzae TaxID=2932493 RepID=UPI002005F990|nr:hypothetical protein [Streptomyces rhizoryzae]MCK7624919.1 hypothetical protein [Streptomyces rhizoryzae]
MPRRAARSHHPQPCPLPGSERGRPLGRGHAEHGPPTRPPNVHGPHPIPTHEHGSRES